MKGNNPHRLQMMMSQSLDELLDPQKVLYKLSDKIPREELEKEFRGLYSKTECSSKPARLMISLLLPKQIYNLGDEIVGKYNFEENIYDSQTIQVIEQTKRLTGKEPKAAIVGMDYRGVINVRNTEIIKPKNPKTSGNSV